MTNRLIGIVKFYTGKFGFVTPDGVTTRDQDIYMHRTALERSGLETVSAGQRVRFQVHDFKGKTQVERIELIDDDVPMSADAERVLARYGD